MKATQRNRWVELGFLIVIVGYATLWIISIENILPRLSALESYTGVGSPTAPEVVTKTVYTTVDQALGQAGWHRECIQNKSIPKEEIAHECIATKNASTSFITENNPCLGPFTCTALRPGMLVRDCWCEQCSEYKSYLHQWNESVCIKESLVRDVN